ncbi:replication/maintenance protein RepL [Comamonas testosteroni]|uniref:replication/maintenance protein RepL n=1 Tax=Comamonas testosteroni TaxID=285 RepID=UPI00265F929E|nr:replication/maintenance protein RepL [Comamonas testosteroni]WKL15988.1 replication/maintenance protein RepL [Comamonas testosteroni]
MKGNKMKVNENTKNELKDELGELVDGMKDGENINVFKGKKKANIKDEFIMVFNKNLLSSVIKYKLTATDISVLLQVIQYVSYGNVINLTHQNIAEDLEIKRQQVSRSFKKLKDAEIFIDGIKGSLFLNPQYLVKGDLLKATESEAYKQIRNKIYKEFSHFYSGKELDEKVHEMMPFTKP